VGKLEEQLALLQAALEEKRRELHTLEEDEVMLDSMLTLRKRHVLPLLARALPVKGACVYLVGRCLAFCLTCLGGNQKGHRGDLASSIG
jgi:hypothetical protein